jgi:hypothetical protein|tara:strand:- start:153 stop:554 length:402 start_codon:yes stop_codon:yes gene_type:complete
MQSLIKKNLKMTEVKCVNLGFIVPESKVREVQYVFEKHAKWMREFYSEANSGDNYLINAFITKATEFIDPTNPNKGLTGNILFTLNEKFTSKDSIKRHNEHASKNEYFQKFIEIKNNYAVFRSAGGEIYLSIK